MPYKPDDRWLLPLLRAIAKRPGQFLVREDVRSLEEYLIGYTQARVDLGFSDFGADEDVLPNFGSWLAVKLRDNRNFNWAGFIEVIDPSPKSVYTFFREFRNFLESRNVDLDCEPGAWPPDPPRPSRPWTPPHFDNNK